MSHFTQSQEQQEEEERRPLAPSSSSSSLRPRSSSPLPQQQQQPSRSSSASSTYQSIVDKTSQANRGPIADPIVYDSDSSDTNDNYDSTNTASSSSSAAQTSEQTTPLVQASHTSSETALLPTATLDAEAPRAHHHHHHHRHRRSALCRRIMIGLVTLSQLGLAIFYGALAVAVAKSPWVYPYSWHPIFMGLYGFVATESILILQPVQKASQKRLARTIHGLVQIAALVFALVGLVAIYVNKERKGKAHFYTNHGIYGCTAIFVFFAQTLFGCFVGYAPRSVLQRCIGGQARIVRIHRVVGYFSIGLMWLALWLAVYTNWMVRNFNYPYIFALGLSMLSVGLVGQVTPSRLWSRSKSSPAARPGSA
ncbi:hypothetical protein BG004_005486 [Podila humilis]|nr:hypothetical protein BG004_005486 [Podila humilis]